MKWSCGHKGHLNLDWLRRHCYSAQTLEKARRNATPKLLTQVYYGVECDREHPMCRENLSFWVPNVYFFYFKREDNPLQWTPLRWTTWSHIFLSIIVWCPLWRDCIDVRDP